MKHYPFDEVKQSWEIRKDQERKLAKLPLDLPADCWQVEIEIAYDRYRDLALDAGQSRQEINVIDIGLEDAEERSIGWSGSERLRIRVNAEFASPGYRPASPKRSKWNLQLGFYKIADEGCQLDITVRQYRANRQWLIGETHAHSVHSDGKLSVSAIRDVAKSVGLDFIFLTDHNTTSGWPELQSDDELRMFPAMELTWYGGHANVYGLKDRGLNYFVNSVEEARQLIADIRSKGAAVSVNHPFEPSVAWTFGLAEHELTYDLIEVWNGPWHQANQDALLYWMQELNRGRRLIMTGGSDTHKPEIFRSFGYPALAVLADNPTEEAVLEAMLHGRSNVLMMPGYPLIRLDIGAYGMGDTVPTSELSQHKLRVEVERFNADSDSIEIYTGGGLAAVLQANDPEGNVRIPAAQQWSMEIEVELRGFVFAIIKRKLPMLGQLPASLTNPIFLE